MEPIKQVRPRNNSIAVIFSKIKLRMPGTNVFILFVHRLIIARAGHICLNICLVKTLIKVPIDFLKTNLAILRYVPISL